MSWWYAVAASGTIASLGNTILIVQMRSDIRGLLAKSVRKDDVVVPLRTVHTPRDRTEAITRPRQVGLSPRGQ